MNLKQKVDEILAKADNTIIDSFFDSSMSDEFSKYDPDEITEFIKTIQDEKIRFEHKENFGGEGQGEDYWSVYEFSDSTGTVYVQFDGWYQSYNGSEFNEFFFVEPAQVQVTKYNKV